jgi:[FeFe] hydrogenase H-cluster maturation GTPase HydF
MLNGLVHPGNRIVLVVPIDSGAPRSRLIKPQAQALREVLDNDAVAIVVKETELHEALNTFKNNPELVVTDSQAIMKVMQDVPVDVKLTTFSILMARSKGNLPDFVHGLKRIEELSNGDKILIAEACTHHAQGEDIGTIKIPKWLESHLGKKFEFTFIHGMDFPSNLSEYKLIIHCGGCMLTRKAMQVRMKEAKLLDVPLVNYGVLISYLHGAIPRVIEPFEEALAEWEKVHIL